MAWEIYLTHQVETWLDRLLKEDNGSHLQVVAAIEALAEGGPNLGRPLIDRIKGANLHNLKELRPGSSGSSEIRVLFMFDPWRSAILLVAGDKSGNWMNWYRTAIPLAEDLYAIYLKERAEEEGAQ
ncbi:MAG TPA: type II toxin-antitoxin system RelE/ParE family toxin [Kineosporiaceae bacterium]|nr:type II toxin-antitoxin system RelE/ParE family toxin [Kineosporiaceae bacterium]